ncbi:MAG: LamG-like jellyroll fold domain-containing protein [Melioribacteraceae bacterium]
MKISRIIYLTIIAYFFLNTKELLPQQVFSKPQVDQIKILPLGNSETFDERVNDTRNIGDKDGYRGPLYSMLKNAGFKFDFVGSEHSGGNILPAGYDENGGFPGRSDSELLTLLKTGYLYKNQSVDRQVTAGPYLNTFNPDIILLHIGTNGNDEPGGTSAFEIQQILDQIDIYEKDSGKEVLVILARIINRVPKQSFVNIFNNNVENMALDRVNNPSNDAYKDNIIVVDMQDSANINYSISPDPDNSLGDMNDYLHPNENGYYKMALRWFDALKSVLPNPPVFITQPTNYYTVEGNGASFSVSVKSNSSVTYQWKKNGVSIPLAASSNLNLSVVSLSDSNSLFSCQVTNVNGMVTSNSAKLFVSKNTERVKNGALVQYDFEEGNGTIIRNKINSDNLHNMNITSPESVEWITNGIRVIGTTNITTQQPITEISNSIMSTNQFSIELWLKTNQEISEPSTIFTISANNTERNLTLNQNSSGFLIKARTTETNFDGIPGFEFQVEGILDELVHLFITKNDLGKEKVFINGLLVENYNLDGNLSNWNINYKLAICNEIISNSPWLGELYYFAIYNRELSNEEIRNNYLLGETGLSDVKIKNELPGKFELLQNYPNPFNPSTTIGFVLPEAANIEIFIHNILGEEIYKTGVKKYSAGKNYITFDANNFASGVYIYSIRATTNDNENYFTSRKMILTK